MSDRYWRKERASWVLTRAGRSPAARRRGEKLMAAARRQDRNMANAGDSAYSEVTTRNIFYRSVMREEGAANIIGWFFWTVIWMGAVALAIGPAIALAWAIYGTQYRLISRLGHPRAAPLLGVAAAVLLLSAALIWLPAIDMGSSASSVYLLVQLVVAFAWAAWLTRAYGWQAVKERHKASSSKIAPIRIDATAVGTSAPPTAGPVANQAPPVIVIAEPNHDEPEKEEAR